MKRGVFCVESNWKPEKLWREFTVKPAFEMLRNDGYPVIHREFATPHDLKHYLGVWRLKRHARFPILYIATHGDPGVVAATHEQVSLDDITDELAGKCRGCIIVFGTCSTLGVSKARLKRFLKETRALMICGYRDYIDWIPPTAFDLVVVYELLNTSFKKDMLMRTAKHLTNLARPFRMGFRVVTRWD